jgi:hypothetical protein
MRRFLLVWVVRAAVMLGFHAKAKPMTSVQVADALLKLEGAAALVECFSSGRKCDAVPVQFVMLKMFPDTSHEELAAGLLLAVTIARLDEAEVEAMDDWRPPATRANP